MHTGMYRTSRARHPQPRGHSSSAVRLGSAKRRSPLPAVITRRPPLPSIGDRWSGERDALQSADTLQVTPSPARLGTLCSDQLPWVVRADGECSRESLNFVVRLVRPRLRRSSPASRGMPRLSARRPGGREEAAARFKSTSESTNRMFSYVLRGDGCIVGPMYDVQEFSWSFMDVRELHPTFWCPGV